LSFEVSRINISDLDGQQYDAVTYVKEISSTMKFCTLVEKQMFADCVYKRLNCK